MSSDTNQWPPPYQIRRSKRARRIHLRITPEHGLELVVPACARLRDPLDMLNTHQAWIQKHLSHFVPDSALQATDRTQSMPTQRSYPPVIHLVAIDEHIKVNYIPHEGASALRLRAQPGAVSLIGATSNWPRVLHALRRWLRATAKTVFTPWICALQTELGLSYRQLRFGHQKTLWGSCSAQGVIALNTSLLFLPQPVVRYVMIHELCHLTHLNHSKKFWKLVGQYDPLYPQHRKALLHAHTQLPSWNVAPHGVNVLDVPAGLL